MYILCVVYYSQLCSRMGGRRRPRNETVFAVLGAWCHSVSGFFWIFVRLHWTKCIFPIFVSFFAVWGLGWGGAITSIGFAHARRHTHTHYTTGRLFFGGTCTQPSCYATGRSLALAHAHTHTHTHVMLPYWTFSWRNSGTL